jgi:hypothetical protein
LIFNDVGATLDIVTKGTRMEQQPRIASDFADLQADAARPPHEGGDLEDQFGGPERDLYPRERFRAALNGEMTPDEYVADVRAFVEARRALDRPPGSAQ